MTGDVHDVQIKQVRGYWEVRINYERELIRRYFPLANIFDPSTDLKHTALDGEEVVMAECFEVVRNSDILVFSSMDGVIGTGVYHEIQEAQRLGKIIFYIYQDDLHARFNVNLRDEDKRSDRLYATVNIDI